MTTHYLGLKSSDKPELAGAEFTEDVEHEGNYALELQNISDLASKGVGYYFSGTSQYIELADNINLDMDVNDFSVSFSIKPNNVTDASKRILSKTDGTTGFEIVINEDDLWVAILDNANNVVLTNLATAVFAVDTLADVFVTFDRSGNIQAYVGGNAVGTPVACTATATIANASVLRIGTETGGVVNEFSGQINNSRLHNFVPTADEVKAFSSGASVSYKYIGANQTAVNAGSFTIGKAYRIVTSGDTDFTLIGADDSNVGTEFVATGVGAGTGTANPIGGILQLEPSGIGQNQWIDSSGNNLHGLVSGAIPTNLPTDHVEKYQSFDISSNQTFTLPIGYRVVSAIVEETSNNALTGDLDVGIGALGQEIVNSEAIGALATVDCTLITLGCVQSLTADTTITISSSDWGSAVLDIYVNMKRVIS